MSGAFLTEIVSGIKLIYFGTRLISIEYNHGNYKTTLKEDGSFFSTVIYEPIPKRFFVYYHISGNEYAGLFSVSDEDVFVTEALEEIYNNEMSNTRLNRKIKIFRMLIKNQNTIRISPEILQFLKK